MKQSAKRVLYLALFLNLLVASAKLLYGFFSNTLSMVADGIHSFSDAASSVMALISIHVASLPSDDDHHYGHHKYETVAALGIGAFVGLGAWEVLKASFMRLQTEKPPEFYEAGLWIMGGGMAINLLLSRYEKRKGKELNSRVLIADAYHTASDFWVSLSVLVSLISIRFGATWIDPIISMGIAGYLAFIAISLVKANVRDLTDTAFIEKERVEDIVMGVKGIYACHHIRTRGSHGQIFIDLHVQIDPKTNTEKAHELVHKVEDELRKNIRGVKDIMIHTEPFGDETIP